MTESLDCVRSLMVEAGIGDDDRRHGLRFGVSTNRIGPPMPRLVAEARRKHGLRRRMRRTVECREDLLPLFRFLHKKLRRGAASSDGF